VLKTSRFVSVFSFLLLRVSEWVSAKGEVREREREVRQQYEQDYCPGLLPRTIAQYYCLSNTKYLHRNYCFKSYLRTIVRIFYSSTTTSFFFLERGAIHPYPKKMRGEGWKLDDQASIVLVRLNACLTRNIWERSEFSVRCLFVLSSHEPRATVSLVRKTAACT
jgi:hypothetical protein